jgi:galactonate dehydratase
MTLETVRGFYNGGWYADVYTENIDIKAGRAIIPNRPGLGTALRDDLLSSPLVQVRTSRKG